MTHSTYTSYLRRIGLVTAAFVMAFVPLHDTASAEEAGQALEIAPPVINLSGDPGETVTTNVRIRDILNVPLVVTGEVNDFVASGEDGSPKLLLEEGETSPYSMKSWFAPLSKLNLQPKEIKQLPIKITIPTNAAPGGYFATVRFTAAAPGLDTSGVSLSASLGSLILMRVNGDAKESMSIAEFTTAYNGSETGLFQSAPITFIERIKNDGNLHEQPAGQITVTDMFGRKVGVVNVNLPPRNILPQSIRRFEQEFDKSVIGNKILFGRYTATLKMTYGSDNKVMTSTTSFWVIPYTLMAVIAGVLVLGFVGARTGLRRYNSHIVKKSRTRR